MLFNATYVNGLALGIEADQVLIVSENEEPYEAPAIHLRFLCFVFSWLFD